MPEGFSPLEVPVFIADVTADVATLAKPRTLNGAIQQRANYDARV